MRQSKIERTDVTSEFLDLGVALGQNQAFSLVAGRCSAAQAATLQRLRQEKKYLKLRFQEGIRESRMAS